MTIRINIFDLDGVMNSISDVRSHLMPTNTDRADHWAEWHKAHVKEKVSPDAVNLVNSLSRIEDSCTVFLSNRLVTYKESTIGQLRNAGVRYPFLLCLRRPLDNTPPSGFKLLEIKTIVHVNNMTGVNAVYTLFDDCAETVALINAQDWNNVAAVHAAKYTG